MSDGSAAPYPLAQRRGAQVVAGALALAAGAIHVAVAPEHFMEAASFGAFMVAVGAFQISAGVLLLTRPTRALVRALTSGSLVVFAIYAVSRTTGLPLGPHPWKAEPIGPVDLLSKALELALLILLVVVIRPGRARRQSAA